MDFSVRCRSWMPFLLNLQIIRIVRLRHFGPFAHRIGCRWYLSLVFTPIFLGFGAPHHQAAHPFPFFSHLQETNLRLFFCPPGARRRFRFPLLNRAGALPQAPLSKWSRRRQGSFLLLLPLFQVSGQKGISLRLAAFRLSVPTFFFFFLEVRFSPIPFACLTFPLTPLFAPGPSREFGFLLP